MFLNRLMILCCTDFLTSWLDSFVRWWCWRIMWSKPDTSAELLRKPKSKSSSLSPLIPPHSHSFFSLIFLLLYPFIPFKSGNYVPRQFLNELSSTLIPQVWAASRLSLVIHCTTLNTTSAPFTGISRLSLFLHLQHFIVIFLWFSLSCFLLSLGGNTSQMKFLAENIWSSSNFRPFFPDVSLWKL